MDASHPPGSTLHARPLDVSAITRPHERLLTIHDVLAAKEVFLTNAIMGLMPVTAIEKHAVATGKPGPMTAQLRDAYEKLLVSETT